ncbi:MAG: serine/threonine protein kinase [Polyangiaceae bacterium]|nr:serine/threonine protein kinase [Polyangiaceae bacterium]
MKRLLSIAVLACAACGPSFKVATPTGFAELDDERYDYRATSADGLVLAVRQIDHDPQADEAFWLKALKNRLHDQGYALLEERPVTSAGGVKGTLLRFGHDEQGGPHLYLVALYVTEDYLFLFEAGGTEEQVKRYDQQIGWARRNLRIDP